MSVKDVADLARPYTFYSLATASAIAIVKIGWTITGYEAVAFAAVILAGASAIYIGKTFENKWATDASAGVEKVRATATPPPVAALAPAPIPDEAAEPSEDPAMFGGPRG